MVDEPPDRGESDSPYETKLKSNWQAGKERAIEAAENPGKSHAEHVEQNVKIYLMVGCLAIVTTLVLFVIVFWDDWPLLDVLFG
ncbi:MAG: hypothetical protein ACR2OA_04210 [Rubripirellula sp.]